MREQTHPRYRPSQHPSGIVVSLTQRSLAAHHLLKSRDGPHGAESCFAEVHLIAVFQCAEQLDAIKRTETEIGIECGVRPQSRHNATGNPRDQVPKRTALRLPTGHPRTHRPSPHEIRYYLPFWLLCVGSGKILLRPFHPRSHALIFSQRFVRPPHHGFQVTPIAQNHDSTRLSIATLFDSYDNAVLHLRLPEQRSLQISWIDVRPTRSDDDLFLPSLEIQIARGVERPDVPRAIPTLLVRHGVRTCRIPIARSHASAFNENLPILRQFHVATRQNFSDRSLPQPKWMIHADQRSGLGESVALNHGVSQAPPELFRVAVERRAARNECPEL